MAEAHEREGLSKPDKGPCCATTILESRDRSIPSLDTAPRIKHVLRKALAYLAGLQGLVRQDVRLIYLARSHLRLRTHTQTV